ncbi:uncharacterized protein TRIADDRAFT_60291 [Trichoplax adhaerens]|uniref:Tight junction protein ZO-1 n=1 Tax=Trichoplax adhaerens TaxID=10228 RepID=B3S7T9_TRIAD|nr:hypothetical protein TRIADDRAFT_60291 [Trichoplax adhaerens]EDV21352.1 hypothetical protein TRIADDRAFT_60291 [Trichoplax adhaerens]|eukprot:XP_002116319.1 hypothetical protein TRIADDRAFT_60291 [Trichoplax adhaerens]
MAKITNDSKYEMIQVVIEKPPLMNSCGFAVTGGIDNPYSEDQSVGIIVKEVLKGGPADGKLRRKDHLIKVNHVSLANVTHAFAVKTLKETGQRVDILLKRKKELVALNSLTGRKVRIFRSIDPRLSGFGLKLCSQVVARRVTIGGPASDARINEGDIIQEINGTKVENMSIAVLENLMSQSDSVELVIASHPSRSEKNPIKTSSAIIPSKSSPGGLNVISHTSREAKSSTEIQSISRNTTYSSPPVQLINKKRESERPSRHKSKLQLSLGNTKQGTNQDINTNTSFDEAPSSSRQQELAETNSQPLQVSPRSNTATPTSTQLSPMPLPEVVDSTPKKSNAEDKAKSRCSSDDENATSRLIKFRKETNLCIQIAGGNDVGIFVASVKKDSPAEINGLKAGDEIIQANGIELKKLTREEAVLVLLDLGSGISLLAKHKPRRYTEIRDSPGDSFYIRCNFDYDGIALNELTFKKGEIFHVRDTMYNGVIGSWQAQRVDCRGVEKDYGIIPNQARGEQIALSQGQQKVRTAQRTAGSVIKKRIKKKVDRLRRHTVQVSMPSAEKKLHEGNSLIDVPAYDKVLLREANFVRPVVILGPIADVVLKKLLEDTPEKFEPPVITDKKGIRISDIKNVTKKNKHCIFEVEMSSLYKLTCAHLYPIVIYTYPHSRYVLRDLMIDFKGYSNEHAAKQSRKLYEKMLLEQQENKHLFTDEIMMYLGNSWLMAVKNSITKQQFEPIWMLEDQAAENDDELLLLRQKLRTLSQLSANQSIPNLRRTHSLSSKSLDEDINRFVPRSISEQNMKGLEIKKDEDGNLNPGNPNLPERAYPEVFDTDKNEDKAKEKENEVSLRKPQAINLEKWPRKRDSRQQSRKRGLSASLGWGSENSNPNSPMSETIPSKSVQTPTDHDSHPIEPHPIVHERVKKTSAIAEAEAISVDILPSHIRPEDIFTVHESDLVPQRDQDPKTSSNDLPNKSMSNNEPLLKEKPAVDETKVKPSEQSSSQEKPSGKLLIKEKSANPSLSEEKSNIPSSNEGKLSSQTPSNDKFPDILHSRRSSDSPRNTNNKRQDVADGTKPQQIPSKGTFGYARSNSRQKLFPEGKGQVNATNKVTITATAFRRTKQDIQSGKRGVVISTGRRKLNGPTQNSSSASLPLNNPPTEDEKNPPNGNENLKTEVPNMSERDIDDGANKLVAPKPSEHSPGDKIQETRNQENMDSFHDKVEPKFNNEELESKRNLHNQNSAIKNEPSIDTRSLSSSPETSDDDHTKERESNDDRVTQEDMQVVSDDPQAMIERSMEDTSSNALPSQQPHQAENGYSHLYDENIEVAELEDEHSVPQYEEMIEENVSSDNDDQPLDFDSKDSDHHLQETTSDIVEETYEESYASPDNETIKSIHYDDENIPDDNEDESAAVESIVDLSSIADVDDLNYDAESDASDHSTLTPDEMSDHSMEEDNDRTPLKFYDHSDTSINGLIQHSNDIYQLNKHDNNRYLSRLDNNYLHNSMEKKIKNTQEMNDPADATRSHADSLSTVTSYRTADEMSFITADGYSTDEQCESFIRKNSENGIDSSMASSSYMSSEFFTDDETVLATAHGVFTSAGGTLSCASSDVRIIIPPGAIPEGVEQDLYFKVYQDQRDSPSPVDKGKGEQLLSPLVMCGPSGIEFMKSVEVRVPHAIAAPNGNDFSFTLKTSDDTEGGVSQWSNLMLVQGTEKRHKDDNENYQIHKEFISIHIDHF